MKYKIFLTERRELCGYRKKVEVVNELSIKELQQYVLIKESIDHFRTTILDSFITLTSNDKGGKIEFIKEITVST